MGTPSFAVPVLEALLDAGYEVVGVWTRPDRPAGRGKQTTPPPVKRFADEHDIPVFQPVSLKTPEAHRQLSAWSPDVIVVAAYGRLIPADILDFPRLGSLNIHPSLLPKYRGPSPVATALLNGEPTTGVTVMKVDEGMDTGPILASVETKVDPGETADALTDRLFRLGAGLLVETLPRWAEGKIEARPQDSSLATTTGLLERSDGEIDWRQSAERIARQVRAYHPWPGAYTDWEGRRLKIVAARVPNPSAAETLPPGKAAVLPDGTLAVGTGDGALAVDRLQLEGGRAVTAAEFVAGHPSIAGSRLGDDGTSRELSRRA